MASIPPKDPNAILDYGVNWTAWLGTDTIVTSDWTVASPLSVDPTPLALLPDRPATSDGRATRVWVGGGTAGVTYDLSNRITTEGGRVDERTLKISVRQR